MASPRRHFLWEMVRTRATFQPFISRRCPTPYCGGTVRSVTKEEYRARAERKGAKIVKGFWEVELFSLFYIVGFNLTQSELDDLCWSVVDEAPGMIFLPVRQVGKLFSEAWRRRLHTFPDARRGSPVLRALREGCSVRILTELVFDDTVTSGEIKACLPRQDIGRPRVYYYRPDELRKRAESQISSIPDWTEQTDSDSLCLLFKEVTRSEHPGE